MQRRYRAAYEAGGDDIVERNHRTVKLMVARHGCPVLQAVHRYNTTPTERQDASTAPLAHLCPEHGRALPVAVAPDVDRGEEPQWGRLLPNSATRGAARNSAAAGFRRRTMTRFCAAYVYPLFFVLNDVILDNINK